MCERCSDRVFMSVVQLPRSLPMLSLVCPHRLAWPRTLPFQGSNTGSNPVGDTTPSVSVQPASFNIQPLCLLTLAGTLFPSYRVRTPLLSG
jgi:hypothetical protein